MKAGRSAANYLDGVVVSSLQGGGDRVKVGKRSPTGPLAATARDAVAFALALDQLVDNL